MNAVHLHFLFNHFPVIGTVLCTGILIAGYVLKNETVKRVALALYFAVALLAIPAYFTGGASRKAIESLPWFNLQEVEEHGKAGFWAFILMDILGVLAAGVLYLSVKIKQYHRQLTAVVLVFSFVVIAAMYRAGNTGGDIRHPEIRELA